MQQIVAASEHVPRAGAEARCCVVLVIESSTAPRVESILSELATQRGWLPQRSAVIVWCLEPTQADHGLAARSAREGEPAADEDAAPVPPDFCELLDVAELASGGRYFLRADRRAWFEGVQLRLGSRAPGEHRPIDRLLLSLAEGWGRESVAVLAASLEDDDGECGLRIIRAVGGIAVRRAPPSSVCAASPAASSGLPRALDEAVGNELGRDVPMARSDGLEALARAIALPVMGFDAELRLVFASRQARDAFGLTPAQQGCELAAIAPQLPGALDLVAAARRTLAEREPRELMVRARQHAYLVRLAAAGGAGSLSLMIAFTDVTPLELAKARAVAQHHRQAAIARLSALALGPADPSAIGEEALSALFGNVHACAAGLVVETRGAGGFDVIASRGLGLDPLGALGRMGDAAVLLDSVAERACIVSQSGDRAAWEAPAGTGSRRARPPRRHPRASAVARGVGCPILFEGRVLGVIALYGRHAGVDDPEFHPFLQAVSHVLGSVLARQRTRRRLALELEVCRVLAGATSLESVSEGLLPALHAALRVDEVELWAADGVESGDPAASSAAPLAASPGAVSLRLGSNQERKPTSRRLSHASCRPGGAASDAATLQGGSHELCIPLAPRDEPGCLLLLRGAQLRQPDLELADGIASLARMLTAFLERLHILAESRQNEAAYRLESAELEALYASLPVGISIHGRGGNVRYVNPYLADLEALGVSPASRALKRLYAEELPAWVARVLELDEPVHDVELFVGDGERTWSWLCNFAPIRDGEGRVLGASAVVHDISAIKRVEGNLREVDHQKDDFLAILGHELRNPIAALRSATDRLGRGESPTPQLRRLHGIFERQTQQATQLIDGLLDVARVARGKVELELAPVPLVQLVRQVLDHREQQLGGRSLERCLPPDEIWVLGDRARLVQVLDNLLSNALEFTRPNGHIGVVVTRSGRRGSIRVEDDGAGIDPELLPHIFEPFRQGGTSTARHAGLGLGLALVKGLIELHGFELRATSGGKGLGACFEFEFPLAAEPDAPAPA